VVHAKPAISRLTAALGLSAAIHILLLLFSPDFLFVNIAEPLPYQEISFLRLAREVVQSQPMSVGEEAVAEEAPAPVDPVASAREEKRKRNERFFKTTSVELPSWSKQTIEPAPVEMARPKAVFNTSGLPDTRMEAASLKGAESPAPLELSGDLVEELLLTREIPEPPIIPEPEPEKGTGELVTSSGLRISGPVTTRAVAYEPPLPSVEFPVEAEVTLKFWVEADGSVSRVIPMIMVDRRLEEIAISYLGRWRFNPLHRDQPDQWGTVTIKFRKK
jgi:TonB family protein